MSLSKHLIKSNMTKNGFLNKVYALSKQFRTVQENFDKKINDVSQAYIDQHCKYSVGGVINFKNNTNGFSHFRIEKIIPDINWSTKIIRFRAIGEFSGFEKAAEKGAIFLDSLKPIDKNVESTLTL